MRADIVDQLVAQVDTVQAARATIAHLQPEELDDVSAELKQRALFFLRRDAPQALAIADLILHIADWHELPRVRALGLQTKAIALTLALGEFEEALDLFAESESIYRSYDDELEIAVGQISQVWALACLQRFEEAFATGERSVQILAGHEDFVSLAAINNNLAAIYGRRGQDHEALLRILDVEAAYGQLGEEGQRRLSLALINKAIVMRNLGRYPESIAANEAALRLARDYSQTANVARAEQNLGMTYFLLGRFARAQALLEKARDTFISDQRYRDAIMAELYISDGLLYLRRYQEVLSKCRQVLDTFASSGTQFEVAQALLNEATALTGLLDYDEALGSLRKARRIFGYEGNDTWQIYTDLEEAAILYRRQKYEASEHLAVRSIPHLQARNLPLKEALALIIAARSNLANGSLLQAHGQLEQALAITKEIDVPVLTYQAHYVKGQLALANGERAHALVAYDQAIQALERLQGQIMVEFRSDFLADKDEVYAHAVDLCLQAQNPRVALTYVERAKSRALLAMLAHHIDLSIEAKSAADRPLVEQILALREKRDRLYRRWETGETPGSSVNREEEQESGQVARDEARQLILQTEDEIKDLWHSLLVRNSAYSREAGLWQVQTRLEQEALGEDSILVEFFELPQGLVVFLVTARGVKAVRLPLSMKEISRRHQKLHHNFNTLLQAPYLAPKLTSGAQGILHALYQDLVAPWIDKADGYRRLIIVPHGLLHYLPFHAFYDGEQYLLQRFQISYLPGSSFIDLSQEPPQGPLTSLVMGHSQNDRLFHVADEVDAVGAALGTRPYLDEEATRSRFQEDAPDCHVLHIAAHGDFRSSNPLFSGFHLQDGLLTTLDVFNLRLRASLATLSACQTGLTLVRGGDEIFGLMRAFLASGTKSLVLSLWPVEDETTTLLMQHFYGRLAQGDEKDVALQSAQKRLLVGNEGLPSAHPYYWAPFFLVGDGGPLLQKPAGWREPGSSVRVVEAYDLDAKAREEAQNTRENSI